MLHPVEDITDTFSPEELERFKRAYAAAGAATRHAEDNLKWVERKVKECVLEGIRKLELFPV